MMQYIKTLRKGKDLNFQKLKQVYDHVSEELEDKHESWIFTWVKSDAEFSGKRVLDSIRSSNIVENANDAAQQLLDTAYLFPVDLNGSLEMNEDKMYRLLDKRNKTSFYTLMHEYAMREEEKTILTANGTKSCWMGHYDTVIVVDGFEKLYLYKKLEKDAVDEMVLHKDSTVISDIGSNALRFENGQDGTKMTLNFVDADAKVHVMEQFQQQGFQCIEKVDDDISTIKSFFELKDRHMDGSIAPMKAYANNVCLIVNVASK